MIVSAKMRWIVILLYMICCSVTVVAQDLEYQDINLLGIDQNLIAMNISGTWSGVGLLSGGIGYLSTDDTRWEAYHATNFLFGALNALVVFKGRSDLIKGKKANWSYERAKKEHKKIERLYLFNNGFNYAFIFGGLYLKEKGKSFDSESKRRGYRGVGEALITQGMFFLIFDTSMYFIQKNFNDKKMDKIIPDEVSLSVGQIGLKWNLN